MTTITFTTRMLNIFKRAIECNWNKINKKKDHIVKKRDIDMVTDDAIQIIDFQGARLEYDFSFYEDHNDEIDFETIRVRYMLCFIEKPVNFFVSTETNLEKLIDQIQSLEEKIFSTCYECNSIAEKDGYCLTCYPFVHSHSENCPICLDDREGVWIKLPCNHIFHNTCWRTHHFNKSDKGKSPCPLCRTETMWCKNYI